MLERRYAKRCISNRLQNIPVLQLGCLQRAGFVGSSSELAKGGRGSGELESQESTSDCL